MYLYFCIISAKGTVFDEEEFSDCANMEYDCDESKNNASAGYVDSDTIKAFINGKQLEFDVELMLINGRMMVLMRVIFEALGAKVDWDGATQTAIGETEKTTMKITIGKDYLLKNDNIVVLVSSGVMISGKTLVPVRAIAAGLDCEDE